MLGQDRTNILYKQGVTSPTPMRLPWQHTETIIPPPPNNNMGNIVIPLLLAAISGAGAVGMLYESRLTETRDIAKASAVKIENMQQQLSEMNTRLNIIVGRLTPQEQRQ